MSHFSILVVGEDVEDLLQPFHEYECTGIDDEYVVWVDAEETEADYEECIKDNEEVLKKYPTYFSWMKDYHGHEQNEHAVFGRKTNPNSKWDWYRVGGRWSGALLDKCGAKVDQLTKSKLDLETARKEAEAEAFIEYDAYESATEGLEAPPLFKKFIELYDDIEDARKAFRDLSWNKALKVLDLYPLQDNVEYFRCHTGGREAFIKERMDGACTTFAVLKDGMWYERGEMGWFGSVSDEKGKDEWNSEWHKMVAGLDDDVQLTVVDCHI